MRRFGSVVLTGTGEKASPCQLIVTVPRLFSLLASSSPVRASTSWWRWLMAGLVLLLGPKRQSYEGDAVCPTCVPVASDTHSRSSPHSLWTCLQQGDRSYDDLPTRVL
jgi:hypothetical protein